MNRFFELALINSAFAGALALLALVGNRLIRRPALSHALWLLVILKLVTPPLVAWPVLPSVGEQPETSGDPQSVEPISNAASAPALSLDELYVPITDVTEEVQKLEIPAVEPSLARAKTKDVWSWREVFLVLYTIWGVGSLAVVLIALARLLRLAQLLSCAPEADDVLQSRVALLAAELGLNRAPRVRSVPGRFTPFVWALGGWSTLIVPVDLWRRLDNEQRTALLLHELAHLRRRDPWVRWIELVATCLYWWNPALWMARRGLHQSEEQCCDAWVVWARPAAARAYASALVSALEFLSEGRSRPRFVPIGASGLGRLTSISRRITMIMNGNVSRRLSWPAAVLMGTLAAVALPCMPTSARLQEKPAVPGLAVADLDDDGKLDLFVPVNDPNVKPGAEPQQEPSGSLDDLKDAVELAKAQLQIKEATVKKAMALREVAQTGLARVGRLRADNVVSEDEVQKATSEVQAADASVAIAEAERQETEVRLRQAVRRLERASGTRIAQPEHVADPTAKYTAVKSFLERRQAVMDRDRAEQMNNLKQIGLALHNYAAAHNDHLPPAAICSKDGAPLLSWRVAILPYLEQDALYNAFRLDEPWDSEHNKALIEKMPKVFGLLKGHTQIRGVQMPGGVFDPNKPEGVTFPEITDGVSNTIAAVLSGQLTTWTRPEPLNEPIPVTGPFLSLFCDGSVRVLEPRDADVLKALLTINGGEAIDPATYAPVERAAADGKPGTARSMLEAMVRNNGSDASSKRADLEEVYEKLKRNPTRDELELMRRLFETQNGNAWKQLMAPKENQSAQSLAEAAKRIEDLEATVADLRKELQRMRQINEDQRRAAAKSEAASKK